MKVFSAVFRSPLFSTVLCFLPRGLCSAVIYRSTCLVIAEQAVFVLKCWFASLPRFWFIRFKVEPCSRQLFFLPVSKCSSNFRWVFHYSNLREIKTHLVNACSYLRQEFRVTQEFIQKITRVTWEVILRDRWSDGTKNRVDAVTEDQ